MQGAYAFRFWKNVFQVHKTISQESSVALLKK